MTFLVNGRSQLKTEHLSLNRKKTAICQNSTEQTPPTQSLNYRIFVITNRKTLGNQARSQVGQYVQLFPQGDNLSPNANSSPAKEESGICVANLLLLPWPQG